MCMWYVCITLSYINYANRVKLPLFKMLESQMTFHAGITLPSSFKSVEAIDVGMERRWHPEIQ